MDAIQCLKSRQSIRNFKKEKVDKKIIEDIIDCGRWAPSGLNHQPWKIVIINSEKKKEELASCTHYGNIIRNAPHVFAIFLDRRRNYNYTKDVQGIGAFFENILLAIHAYGLGGVWLGEIYNHSIKVKEVLEIKENDDILEFMGAIAFGIPDEKNKSQEERERIPLSSIILKEY